jgi:RNA polymerase sigma-70 factor (ECF subfamily)
MLTDLYAKSQAGRWAVPQAAFEAALERSAAQAFRGRTADAGEVQRYLSLLHLTDLALACACALGRDAAWDHFIQEFRPRLYRAADALAPGGAARELADALYADLFGIEERAGVRRSLFEHFHGRSSLATWLRAVLAQRYVDRFRSDRRLAPLRAEEAELPERGASGVGEIDRSRFNGLVRRALAAALETLPARDRLRLGCYYAQDLTLAEIGRLLGEHEATVSRHLTRTRRALRDAIAHDLRTHAKLDEAGIAECFHAVMDDPGSIDLAELVAAPAGGKVPPPGRSE